MPPLTGCLGLMLVKLKVLPFKKKINSEICELRCKEVLSKFYDA